MSNVPSDLRYSESHEWVRDNGDGTVTIGITDHAQEALGDLVFVELPELDAELDTEDECGVVESVKAASDLYAPLSGVVTEVNEALDGEPELVNGQPYDDGWVFKMQITDMDEFNNLMDAEAYQALLEDE